MSRSVIHPKMLSRLEEHFFTQRCKIEQASVTQDNYGAASQTWATLEDHGSIPCVIAAGGGQEERDEAQKTVTDATHTIMLSGRYDQITTAMRAVVDGVNYDIRAVDHDSKERMTRLLVRLVTV